MDPYRRFTWFKDPLAMIAWNALLGCETYERLTKLPDEADTAADVRNRHRKRLFEDGVDSSGLDSGMKRVPFFCYLGYALADYGLRPLDSRLHLKWYPVDNVCTLWSGDPEASRAAFQTTGARIERRYGVILKDFPRNSLP